MGSLVRLLDNPRLQRAICPTTRLEGYTRRWHVITSILLLYLRSSLSPQFHACAPSLSASGVLFSVLSNWDPWNFELRPRYRYVSEQGHDEKRQSTKRAS